MIWNPKAIDYSKKVRIFDPKTKKYYSEKTAKNLPIKSIIRKRLINKPKKIGCFVFSLKKLVTRKRQQKNCF